MKLSANAVSAAEPEGFVCRRNERDGSNTHSRHPAQRRLPSEA